VTDEPKQPSSRTGAAGCLADVALLESLLTLAWAVRHRWGWHWPGWGLWIGAGVPLAMLALAALLALPGDGK
jgi:hypothetical protein